MRLATIGEIYNKEYSIIDDIKSRHTKSPGEIVDKNINEKSQKKNNNQQT